MRPLDLKYGMWTVVEDRGQRVLCRCDCGTEADVLRTDLNRHDQKKRSTSCGCRRRAYDRATTTIQPGDRFGRLTAVARVSSGRDKRWRFVCDCGKETVPVLSYVIKGASRSCGCRLREARTHAHMSTSSLIWGRDHPPNIPWRGKTTTGAMNPATLCGLRGKSKCAIRAETILSFSMARGCHLRRRARLPE
jgi:hypothetical protein